MDNSEDTKELRVAADTDVQHLATAIVRYNDEGSKVHLSCIGVHSISQGVKATAIANGKVAPAGFIYLLLPAFDMTHFRDNQTQEMVERTVLKLQVIKYSLGS
jgi:stage V sporulation protein SpoVS